MYNKAIGFLHLLITSVMLFLVIIFESVTLNVWFANLNVFFYQRGLVVKPNDYYIILIEYML